MNRYVAIVFAALLVCFLPLACIANEFTRGADAVPLASLNELGTMIGCLAVGLVATIPAERMAEIRGLKSPKVLRETVSELNKEIQDRKSVV